jgi:purine-binding chemotaxis protein CheW
MTDFVENGDTPARFAAKFWAGRTVCGLETSVLQEITRVGHITKAHQAPAYVLGLLNLRGRLVTVLDTCIKLGLPPTTLTPDCRILIVDCGGELIGLLVEREAGVVPLTRFEWQPPPENVGGIPGALFKGICFMGGQSIAMLNLAALTAVPNSQGESA